LEAVREAGAFLRPAFHSGYQEDLDKKLEPKIRLRLTEAFPNYGYKGEETTPNIKPRDIKGHLWLVDPHDGTHAAAKGHRGSAVSIALLRKGIPILGVVFAYCAPDDEGDLFWWAEGLGPLRRNDREIKRTWAALPNGNMTVLISQDADCAASVNASVAHPMRFRGIPGIAYRLALVAAGEGDLAISLNGPTGWDVAGGHALLRGAGGDLFGNDGSPVTYNSSGDPEVSLYSCFGGSQELVQSIVRKDWRSALHRPREEAKNILAYLKPGKTVADAGVLARAQGCLLGQFAGDALGSLVEFQSSDRIRSRYSDGPRVLEDGGQWNTIAGQPTDDSELALALARSIIKKGGYGEEESATAYAQWYDSHPFDIGNTTSMALSPASRALQEGKPVALAAQGHANHSSQANGALMRVSPLAIFGSALQPYEISRFARTDAGTTHPNEVCRAANAVFAVAISYAIKTGYNAQIVYRYAWSWAHDKAIDPSVLESLEAAEFEVPRDFLTNMGWVRIAFQNAFYQLLHATSLQEGVINTVRHGGDTDTNAAIAGALLGAVHGRRGIPPQWMDRLLTCRPINGLQGVLKPRPATYWPVDALALAEQLLLAGLQSSYKPEFPTVAVYQNGDEWKDRGYKFQPLGHVPSVTDFDVVLGFIPMFEKKPIEPFYRWEGGGVAEDRVITIPRPVRDWKIDEFIWCLINHGFVQDFDWPEWKENAGKKYVEDPNLFDSADLGTCIKLLTTFQRGDRFCDGLLAHLIESGQLLRVLLRLRALREAGAIRWSDSGEQELPPSLTGDRVAFDANGQSTTAVSGNTHISRDASKSMEEVTFGDEQTDNKGEVSLLLEILAVANNEIGARSSTSMRIRRELRKRGHRGGLRNE
jgi:ADP-ribosylglycohydrolase/fructose-1,6-bisphosphatase/inositol monophosphatase family enzyme